MKTPLYWRPSIDCKNPQCGPPPYKTFLLYPKWHHYRLRDNVLIWILARRSGPDRI